MKKKHVLNLLTLRKQKKWIWEFREKIFESLGKSLFELTDVDDFIFKVLSQVYPVNKGLENNKESLERACNEVFEILKIRGATIIRSDEGKTIEIEAPEKAPFQKLLNIYLQIETLPAIIKKELEGKVREDLERLNTLIKWYETENFIQSVIRKQARPANHEERILFDFYFRCVHEQKNILDYFLNGINRRAIQKANYLFPSLRGVFSWFESYKDKPYLFARDFSYPLFDCRKIDLIGHRISNYPIDEAQKLHKLYETNKQKFYKIFFKHTPPTQLIHEFDFYFAHLPFAKDRKLIFEELKSLFKAKRWIGFYALALTQVEGLFTEMYNIINPTDSNNKKSLPDKVHSVRPFHDMSTDYFDYYQYYIPTQRNKFMHSGHDEDFKLKSFDLLVDLNHLFQVFFELKDPLVKIKRLHARRNFNDFISFEDFSHYFEMLNQLHPSKQKEIKDSIQEFEKNFLVTHCNIEYITYEICEFLPKELKDILDKIHDKLKGSKIDIDFQKSNEDKILSIILNPAMEGLKDELFFSSSNFSRFLAYYNFLGNYKKQLPSLQINEKILLDDLQKEYGRPLQNIVFLHQSLLKKH